MIYIKLLILFSPFVYPDIINLEIHKYVDITSQIVKIDTTITFRNNGSSQITNYCYTLDPDVTDAYIEFYSSQKLKYEIQNQSTYIVHLNKPIYPNLDGVIRVEVMYLNKIKTLLNKERKERTVHYSGNLYLYSPYQTMSYYVMYHINKMEFLDVSVKPSSANRTDFMYDFWNIPPYSFRNVTMHYINDVPFFVVTRLERTIDVSHLGSIFIEDNVELINEGPRLTTKYEIPLVRQLPQLLHTYLPASASRIKLFDDIGDNSKSSIIQEEDYITLRFEARYPLKQSWKTKYTLQYNLPLYEYLRKTTNQFSFKMRVVDHILPDVIIRDVRTKVLLPQDSEIVSVTTAMGVKRGEDERSVTALSFDRLTVVFTTRNLPENCVPEFVITYTAPLMGLFKPAMLISAYIEIVLISYIAFRRIGMYLNKDL